MCWVAQQIKDALPGQPIGLYAGGSNSGFYSDGSFLRKGRIQRIEQARQRLDEVKPFHAFDERYSRVEESPTHRGLPYGRIPV